MPISKEIQEMLARKLRKELPLMDIDKIREEFLAWLADFKFPGRAEKSCWENCLTVIPRLEGGKELEQGIKMRFALSLFTAKNKYLISVLECFDPDARENYILTVHTNWDETEKRMLRFIENQYDKEFDDGLKPRHTIWAQTFKEGELGPALDSAAKAILGEELTADTDPVPTGKTMSPPKYSAPLFPESCDEKKPVD